MIGAERLRGRWMPKTPRNLPLRVEDAHVRVSVAQVYSHSVPTTDRIHTASPFFGPLSPVVPGSPFGIPRERLAFFLSGRVGELPCFSPSASVTPDWRSLGADADEEGQGS